MTVFLPCFNGEVSVYVGTDTDEYESFKVCGSHHSHEHLLYAHENGVGHTLQGIEDTIDNLEFQRSMIAHFLLEDMGEDPVNTITGYYSLSYT